MCSDIFFWTSSILRSENCELKEQMTSADKCLQTASCATWKLFPRLKQNDYQWKETWIGLFRVLNSPIPIQRSPLEFDIFRVERSPAHVQLINFSPPALIFRKIRTVPLGRCLLLLVRTCSMHRARHGLPPRARCGRDVINYTAKYTTKNESNIFRHFPTVTKSFSMNLYQNKQY